MRPSALLSIVVIVACASGSPQPAGAPQPQTTVTSAGGSNLRVGASDGPHTTSVAYPVDAVFTALPAVFASLGVAITVNDPRQHAIGNQGMKIRQKLGKVRLSTYIDCGNAISGMASADSYDVILSVVTLVQPKGTASSDIVTTVEASAKPASFSADYQRCGTTGALENRIYEMVKASLVR